jgi:ABC-type spermidine/putrescine transport system permease subunit II
MLLPLFIPGVSMGLASAFFFKLVGIAPSLLTVSIVQTLWALPFATLVILTAMSGFDPVYLEAAYMSGADRFTAFRDVELPLIWPGISGAAIFSLVLSFNETIRTSLVQGPLNTVQTYIWSTYKQIGLSPALYALMSLLILVTLALVGASLLARAARERRPA